MKPALLPAADRIATPWKNGGGVTWEVAVSPGAVGFDFDWRISIAEVAVGGPFSRFPEIDRILTVLDGAMRLSIPGREPALLNADAGPYRFPGDVDCEAELIAPVIDLNVMTRRGGPCAAVTLQRGGKLVLKSTLAVVIARSALVIAGCSLSSLDAVRLDGALGDAIDISGEGWVVEIDP